MEDAANISTSQDPMVMLRHAFVEYHILSLPADEDFPVYSGANYDKSMFLSALIDNMQAYGDLYEKDKILEIHKGLEDIILEANIDIRVIISRLAYYHLQLYKSFKANNQILEK